MKATKILSLILAAIMLCSVFLISCAKEDPSQGNVPGNTPGGNVTPQDPNAQYDAEIKNLNEHEFRFIVRGTGNTVLDANEVYAEQPNGEKVNDAVFARNMQLADKYNCTIAEDRVSNVANATREPLQAGEYVADFLYDGCNTMRSLAIAGLLADATTLDNINLDKVWWDQYCINSMNLGGKVFYLTGDAATLDERASWILYYNKDIMAEYDPSINLYQEVRDGKWTVDRMYQLVDATARDDGDGVWVAGKDRFGYVTEAYTNYVHVVGCGVTVSNVSSSGDVEIPAQPKPELLAAWEACRNLLTTQKRLTSWASANFRDGLATFYACHLGTAMNAGSMIVSYGYLPFPKMNEQQSEYFTTGTMYSVGVYSIPVTVDNCEDWETNGFTSGREQAAYFLEAFSYYSMSTLTPAFMDEVVGKQAVKDTDSIEMLEISLKNKIYDPIVGANMGSMQSLFQTCGSGAYDTPGTDENYDTFVSTYTSRVLSARKELQDYIQYLNAGV